jgi:hypothetical protein
MFAFEIGRIIECFVVQLLTLLILPFTAIRPPLALYDAALCDSSKNGEIEVVLCDNFIKS